MLQAPFIYCSDLSFISFSVNLFLKGNEMFFKVFSSLFVVLVLAGCVTNDGLQKNASYSVEHDDEIFKKWQKLTKTKSSGSLVDLKVDYAGKYKISEVDEHLMKTYHRRFVYREFKRGKKTFRVPSYDYLKMSRSGNNWKIVVEEKKDGSFTIKGKNSEGKNLDTVCKQLKDCFKLM